MKSFASLLPWAEYLDEHGVFLLRDNQTLGAAFEITPLGTAGRSEAFLADIRDTIEAALQDVFDEHDVDPWVLQTYTFDERDIEGVIAQAAEQVAGHARGSTYTDAYFDLLRAHYRGISQAGGLFDDETVTQTRWGGRLRRNYLILYKQHYLQTGTPAQFNAVCDKLASALRPIGYRQQRLSGWAFHNWLTRFFNPGTDHPALMQDAHCLPVGDAFADTLLYCHPRSDPAHSCWWFQQHAARCLSIDGIRRRPAIGHCTGEVSRGDASNAMLDLLPDGAIFVSTLVVVPQDTVEHHINRIEKSAIGEGADSARTQADCASARQILGERHKFYRASYALYLQADSLEALDRISNEARAVLLNYHFRAIAIEHDVRALDNFLVHLPMNYRADLDQRRGWRQCQLTVTQHIANMSPIFGRSRGTGRQGIDFFNRGGEPLTFNPLHPADRSKNAHLMLLGPSGSGKSATLVSMLASVMAVSRPRLFIIEAGGSFDLLGDWFGSLGLSVNTLTLQPGNGVSLNPFAHLPRALNDGEQRDILGEAETAALLMITGGEKKEADRLHRADRRLIRDALLSAARTQAVPITAHVRQAFYDVGAGEAPEIGRKLRAMGDAIGLFCDGFAGEIFNREGAGFPECDVTIINLATVAREDYTAELSLAVIACLNTIQTIAERDQSTDRQLLTVIDEAHLLTTSPLIAPALTKWSKMGRKLGSWLWQATQNMGDYPGEAEKMLNQAEFWLALVQPRDEIEQIARFRELNAAQRQLLLSASKQPACYTEGVLMSDKLECLFRVVPPSLLLSLAGTEKHEKAARAALMAEHGITELDAARQMARQIDRDRGIRSCV